MKISQLIKSTLLFSIVLFHCSGLNLVKHKISIAKNVKNKKEVLEILKQVTLRYLELGT